MKTKYEKPTAQFLGNIQDAEGLCATGTAAYGTACVSGSADANCGSGSTPGQHVPTFCGPGSQPALCTEGSGALG